MHSNNTLKHDEPRAKDNILGAISHVETPYFASSSVNHEVDNAPLDSQSHMDLVNDPSRKENDAVCLAPNSQTLDDLVESHLVQEEDEQSMDCH
ncbi:unnamed protein product [Lupinus luteus]|uniref:Uncharacterized protein n=1 Tax=Lupinus luteus TaxID=3873 RepID=A0AAV1XHR9_LUPLU